MKVQNLRIFILLTFLLNSFFIMNVNAFEESVNHDLRRRIKAVQNAKNGSSCQQVFNAFQIQSLLPKAQQTRTRGIQRGLEAKTELDQLVEEFSKNFGPIIQAEFSVPYGAEKDSPSYLFFKNEGYEGKEKLKVLTELGYRWKGKETAPEVSPSWMEVAKKYRDLLIERDIDLKETFVPALVFFRANSDGKVEHKLVDPLSESLPSSLEGWQVLNKDVQFNLPFSAMLMAMREGKFPLLDAVHDLSHFISFLRFPELAREIRKEILLARDSDITPGFKRRQYWLTESLSVLDPNSTQENIKFLNKWNRPVGEENINSIENSLKKMKTQELIQYALDSAQYFESKLRDISGGNSSAPEKWYYTSLTFGMSPDALLNKDISQLESLNKVYELARTYFQNKSLKLNINPKIMTNETVAFSFSTFVNAQKILALYLSAKKDISSKTALEYLRQFVARTEYLLSAEPYTYTEWAQHFLRSSLDPESRLAKTLMVVFGNEIVSKFYIGVGLLRKDSNLAK